MAALRLLLAAALAVQALMGLANATPNSPTSQGLSRALRSMPCPVECLEEGGRANYKGSLFFTPRDSAVTLTYRKKTPLGPKLPQKVVVEVGETMNVSTFSIQIEGQPKISLSEPLNEFFVSGAIWYCTQPGDTDPECLTTTTTSTTTTTITTTTTTTTASTEATAAGPIHSGSQGLEMFLLILSVASVLLRLLLVAKGGLAYYRTLAGLDRSIAAAKAEDFYTSPRRLYSLRNALVLDFGLRLCLCVLLPCVCVYVYSIYLTFPQDSHSLSVAFYILGIACLLLHGFFCSRKVNSVIKTVMVAQQRTRSASRRRHRRHSSGEEESSVSGSSEGEQAECSTHVVTAVLKVCLLLLLLCLCILSFSVYHVVTEGLSQPSQEA